MIIISDTTPIISLMKISQLELLEKMFDKKLSLYQKSNCK